MSNHTHDRGAGIKNTPEVDFVRIKVSSTEFKNVNQGGVIQDANPEAKLYLSLDGNVRLVQGTVVPPLGQAGFELYDFDKGDWTPTGKNLVKSEKDRTNLLNATKIELQREIARRKKSGKDQKDVTIGADSIIDASGIKDREDESPDKKEEEKGEGEKSNNEEANIYDLQSQLKKLQKTDECLT